MGFVVELLRGLDGHLPAWVYVVEWPLFGVGGVVVWWRLQHDDVEVETRDDEPAPGADPGLDAWRDYVASLESRNTSDPG